MEASGTGAAAMLVAMTEDVGDVRTQRRWLPRGDRGGARLRRASELILEVQSGEGAPQDVQVAWERSDLEASSDASRRAP